MFNSNYQAHNPNPKHVLSTLATFSRSCLILPVWSQVRLSTHKKVGQNGSFHARLNHGTFTLAQLKHEMFTPPVNNFTFPRARYQSFPILSQIPTSSPSISPPLQQLLLRPHLGFKPYYVPKWYDRIEVVVSIDYKSAYPLKLSSILENFGLVSNESIFKMKF